MSYVADFNLYANCSDLWQMALPPDTLFCDGGIEPGQWSGITKVGLSSGTVAIDLASNPRDDFSVVLKCISGGELNVDGVVNPGAVPTFAISLNNGITYSPVLTPQGQVSKTTANGTSILNYQLGGFRLLLNNGTAPSFIATNTWSFTTSASPDCIRALSRSSRFVENYLQDTYQLPYTSWGDDLRGVVCEMARWYLIRRRGLHQNQDMVAYKPDEAMHWLTEVAKGNIQPAIIEKNGAYLFPDVVHARCKYEMDWRM
jgi:hypothetical protein